MIYLFTLLVSISSSKTDTIDSATVQKKKTSLLSKSIIGIVICCDIIALIVIFLNIYLSFTNNDKIDQESNIIDNSIDSNKKIELV